MTAPRRKRIKPASPAAEKSKYGGRGRPWHPAFVEYMERIVNDPAYAGMPDVYYEPGRIQWEAPSNRATGQFKDTNARRMRWWAEQAAKLGISTSSHQWISRVAKAIHPYKKKPCKICGRTLELRYVYPQQRFLDRIRKLPFVESGFSLEPLEPIHSLVERFCGEYGSAALDSMPDLFKTAQVPLPTPLPSNAAQWLTWIDQEFVAAEPRGFLSPGAMSNPPDRFDGFHCDNLCCRATADTGRHKKNLQTYVTDRRVFEYWAAGDWLAADRLMGALRAEFPEETCRHGHPGPCAADHIGPISLGFTHRARFQLLCNACNSSKNNRMYQSDVALLLADEKAGEQVVSWHSQSVWDACKGRVTSDEHARRLSKLMRDNRHAFMHALRAIADAGAYAFLATLLELEQADYNVEFRNLRIEDHVTVLDEVVKTSRSTKYADEQKARRCRVAFGELETYFQKANRNAHVVNNATSDRRLELEVGLLKSVQAATAELDEKIRSAATSGDPRSRDAAFRDLLPQIAAINQPAFAQARQLLREHMDTVGAILAAHWDDDRYVRELEQDPDNQATVA